MPSKPQRLFVKSRSRAQTDIESEIELEPAQAHYLINVLRCKAGEQVLLFNGKDGEWLGGLEPPAKKRAIVAVIEQTRQQAKAPRPALSLRAAEARAPRLHGAKGDGDWRSAAHAGDHAPDCRRARQ